MTPASPAHPSGLADFCWPLPAQPGDPLASVDTPALLLDLDAFDRNLARMQDAADAAGVALRPHAKAHKCPAIALAQMARGARGICCQKASEALPFLQAGITDIHVSNEVVGPVKARRLASMARHGRFSVCVDDLSQVDILAHAAAEEGSRLGVFIEINIGQDRCGVNDAPAALRLLEAISRHPQLAFAGLQAYHGGLQHLRSRSERQLAVVRASVQTTAFVQSLAGRGVSCPTVTGAGTGSVEFDLAQGIYTEVQPGSYIFMDGDYGRNEQGGLRFEQSLFVATAVMSDRREGQVVVDAGLKSLAVDSGLPAVWGEPGLRYAAANDEHGIVQRIEAGAPRPALGSLLRLVAGHCDPTLNLHDHLVGYRGDRVECVWPVSSRGMSR
jgi:D-serine deaminase-like pyridoxal phosphate-dependent protein